MAIYQDGTVDVSYPNSNYVNANISIKELSRSLETLQGISVGDKLVRTVIGQHYNVQVLEIYEDGTADVSYPNTDYVNGNVSITELGPSSDKN
ncbi:MAG: hypothetical protein Q7U04_15110 [Bacteriovorax sp.]|nr:hypothetical protein [Bacteriovorax sp.]